MTSSRPTTREQWRAALDELPVSDKIPAFFFAHGSPMLIWPDSAGQRRFNADIMAPKGPLVQFLQDFGPALLKKYKPKAIVVFSAHWETGDTTLVSDWGDEDNANGFFHDFYGFPAEVFEAANFHSHGNAALARRIVELLTKANIAARTTPKLEPRGRDGLGKNVAGLDHGCTVPFTLMFGRTFNEIPIVEVSIDGSLEPEKEWALGRALDSLRSDGVLILSGGLPIHTFREPEAFAEKTARPIFKDFSSAILDAVSIEEPSARRNAMFALTKHAGFRPSNPREEHFVPLYVAGGAGQDGKTKILAALYGAPTIAFGL